MPGPDLIESFAIVSEDGMLADSHRVIPDELKVEADQKFFHDGLLRAVAVVHGRHSHEGGPSVPGRFRLITTRRIANIGTDASLPVSRGAKTLLWNPQGASLEQAWTALGAPAGTLAVIGGPEVYGLFLQIGYDIFHLTRVPRVRLPGGRPVFPAIGPDRRPEDVLAEGGLKPGPARLLDADKGVTLVTWTRTGPR